MKKILLVEDDLWLANEYVRAFKSKKIQCIHALGAQQAVEFLDLDTFDLIIVDFFLPVHNGLSVIHEIKSYEDSRRLPIVMLSSYDFANVNATLKHMVEMVLDKTKYTPKQLVEKIMTL